MSVPPLCALILRQLGGVSASSLVLLAPLWVNLSFALAVGGNPSTSAVLYLLSMSLLLSLLLVALILGTLWRGDDDRSEAPLILLSFVCILASMTFTTVGSSFFIFACSLSRFCLSVVCSVSC